VRRSTISGLGWPQAMCSRSACVSAVIFALCPNAAATPNVSLDDPRYLAMEAEGLVSGFRPLSEAELERLHGTESPRGWWTEPVHRLTLSGNLVDEAERPYSTSRRERNLVGSLATSCEGNQGRPCGTGTYLELESAAGFGTLIAATVRLRAAFGYADELEVDRAYVHSDLGLVALEAGRDILVFGPSVRTQLGWGTNAPPIDHVRVSTSRPIRLGSSLKARGVYALGVMQDPQTYPHNLVSIGRVQVDVADAWHLGVIQLLQLGGDGAPEISAWNFLLEHVRRRDSTASATDSSNRRFGGDVALRASHMWLYYSLVFEDIRRARVIDAFRYDADHLLGVRAQCGGAVCVFEWHQTGVRSQEHAPRITGFSNRGRLTGSPLGPDAKSFYAHTTFRVPSCVITPWLEFASLSSDTYTFVLDGPITPDVLGSKERRYRLGARAAVTLSRRISITSDVFVERVQGFGFDQAASRNNAGLSAQLEWTQRPVAVAARSAHP
jgi:hypothetical protein